MADHIDHPPVHLLRPRPVDVAGAQAGLDMADRDAVMERGQGRGHRRGGIAMHQHVVGADLRVERVKPFEQPGTQAIEGLVGHHDIEVMVGGDLEQRHHLVEHRPVLAGDADHRFDIRSVCRARTSGPILMASGRVPNTDRTFTGALPKAGAEGAAVATSGSFRRCRPAPAGRRRSPHEETPNSRHTSH
jgi:hypothetical protein